MMLVSAIDGLYSDIEVVHSLRRLRYGRNNERPPYIWRSILLGGHAGTRREESSFLLLGDWVSIPKPLASCARY